MKKTMEIKKNKEQMVTWTREEYEESWCGGTRGEIEIYASVGLGS